MSERYCKICEEIVYGDGPHQLCDQCLTTVLFGKEAHSDNWTRFIAEYGKDEYYRRVQKYRGIHDREAALYRELEDLQKKVESDMDLLPQPSVEIREILTEIHELTPDLILHLKRKAVDLERINPTVFEHLVGEFFVQRKMFRKVALVGRDASTSADLFCGTAVATGELKLRVFVETKRHKDNVGVQVIDKVLGAMLGEKSSHGWDMAMLVTISQLANIKKYSSEHIRRLGVTVKDRTDLLRWLNDYSPNEQGLWLPNPSRRMPIYDPFNEI